MTVSFDKKLAELDAYLQMLIEQSEDLDRKLELDSSGSDERDGLLLIKNNLESLLGSIKHAIVLLQIAKVSIRSSSPIMSSPQGQIDRDEECDDDDESFYDASTTMPITTTTTTTTTTSTPTAPTSAIATTATTTTITSPTTPTNTNNSNSSSNNNNNTMHDEDEEQLDESEEEEDLGSLDSEGSVIKHLLSQIRIGMDLTKVVLPTFILERRSLLEMYADFFAHPDLFSSIPDYETPELRMVELVRWYLSAFHAGRKSSVAKKPYNPILGEIFLCNFNCPPPSQQQEPSQRQQQQCDIDRTTNKLSFVAEQVSHHPPVSAFYAENPEKLITCSAHIYTKSKYLGLSVGVHNIGQGVISLLKHKETYVCTFPSAYGRSILTVPWVELGGSVNISCEQSGYSASIEFVTKPFYGGKKHRVMGEIVRPNKEPFMTIDGEWNGCMYSKSPPNSSDKQVFVDTTSLPVIKKHVRPIGSQESLESRNVWKEVTKALKVRDVVTATAAKSSIEQRQRDLLKDRMEKGVEWRPRYFEATDEGWTYVKPLE